MAAQRPQIHADIAQQIERIGETVVAFALLQQGQDQIAALIAQPGL